VAADADTHLPFVAEIDGYGVGVAATPPVGTLAHDQRRYRLASAGQQSAPTGLWQNGTAVRADDADEMPGFRPLRTPAGNRADPDPAH